LRIASIPYGGGGSPGLTIDHKKIMEQRKNWIDFKERKGAVIVHKNGIL
jgi:hypothetical protein